MTSIADLEAARAELVAIQAKFDRYTGNNPDKYQTELRDAAARIRTLESDLKASGQIQLSPQEMLDAELDRLYPKARSKDIVEHEGQRYQLRFFPLSKSRTGKTVNEWGHTWAALGAT